MCLSKFFELKGSLQTNFIHIWDVTENCLLLVDLPFIYSFGILAKSYAPKLCLSKDISSLYREVLYECFKQYPFKAYSVFFILNQASVEAKILRLL